MNLSLKMFGSASLMLLVLLALMGESLGRSRGVEGDGNRPLQFSSDTAPQLMAFNPVTIEGKLGEQSEISPLDSYYNNHVFSGQAGDQIAIELISNDFDAYLLLQTTGGKFVALNDDGGDGSNARIITTLPASSDYRIRVTIPAFTTPKTGDYTLIIKSINPANSPGGIGKLDNNSQVFGDRTYYNRHFIEGKKGDQIAIELDSEDFDPYLILRDPEGNVIAENNDRVNNGWELVENAGLIVTLPESGTYEAIAKADTVGATGSYRLIWRGINIGDPAGARIDRHEQKEFETAFYDNAVKIYRAIGDRHREALSLVRWALIYESDDSPRAIEMYRQAIDLYQELGKRSEAELAFRSLGRVYKQFLEDYPKAIETFEQSIDLARGMGNRSAERQSLQDLAQIYTTIEEYDRAIEYYEQILVFAREIEDRVGTAGILENLGDIYTKFAEYPRAIAYYEQVLAMHREDGDRSDEARTFMDIARIYQAWDNEPEAIAFYEKAFAIMEEEGDQGGIEYVGEILRVLARSPRERQLLKDWNAEADRLLASGIEQFNERQFPRALQSWETAAELYQQIEDRFQENLALVGLGNVYYALGNGYYVVENYAEASDRYQKSFDTFRTLDDRTREFVFGSLASGGESSALIGLGNVARAQGENERAIELYQQSRESRSGIVLVPLTAQSVRNLGNAYLAAGEYLKALQSYNELFAINRDIDNFTGQGIASIALGDTYLALGEPSRAIEFYQRARSILRELGDTDVKADSGIFRDTSLGITYRRSANITRDRAGEGKVLIGLGNAHLAAGDTSAAIAFYRQSLAVMEANRNRLGQGTALIGLGNAYLAEGDYSEAIAHYQQSLAIMREVREDSGGEALVDLDFAYEISLTLDRDRVGEGTALTGLGNAYLAREEYPRAVASYQQSLQIMKEIGNRPGEKDALAKLARAKYRQGNLEGAIADIRAAIAISESIRARVESPELRQSFFATVSEDYQLYIDILMELHRLNPDRNYDKQALNISERSRARTLAELLAEANLDIRKDVDPQLLKEEQRLLRELSKFEQRRLELVSRSYNNAELEGIKTERDLLLLRLAEVETSIRSTSPTYADLRYPQPLTLEEIQGQILDEDTLLLEYTLGEERSYLFAVGQNSFASYELPPRQEIEAAVKKYAVALQAENRNPLAEGKELAQMLLGPIADMLKGQRLAIVADGKLHRLPFGALPWGASGAGEASGASEASGAGIAPLLANHEIVNLSSASSLAIQRQQMQNRPRAAKKLAVFADPVFTKRDSRLTGDEDEVASVATANPLLELFRDGCQSLDRLPYTRTEADNILSLVPDSQKFLAMGFAADRTAATHEELAQYEILHLSTHGCIHNNPQLSGLALSLYDEEGQQQDGFLRLQDIYNLQLNADLVVLSACQTGIGEEVSGEGVVGLTRGFMYAGARRVTVSLWNVSDRATADLMSEYYKKMLSEGKSPAAALREAQLQMWKAGEYPYKWAAFVMQGDWQ